MPPPPPLDSELLLVDPNILAPNLLGVPVLPNKPPVDDVDPPNNPELDELDKLPPPKTAPSPEALLLLPLLAFALVADADPPKRPPPLLLAMLRLLLALASPVLLVPKRSPPPNKPPLNDDDMMSTVWSTGNSLILEHAFVNCPIRFQT
jgi:hypothetical protein